MTAPQESHRVAIVLMKGPEGDATVDVLRADQPQVHVQDQGTYWLVSGQNEITIDLKRVSEELGEEISLPEWLVVMSSFVGRAVTEPDMFRVTSEVAEFAAARRPV